MVKRTRGVNSRLASLQRVANFNVGDEIAGPLRPGPVPIARPLETPLMETSPRWPPLVLGSIVIFLVVGLSACVARAPIASCDQKPYW